MILATLIREFRSLDSLIQSLIRQVVKKYPITKCLDNNMRELKKDGWVKYTVRASVWNLDKSNVQGG